MASNIRIYFFLFFSISMVASFSWKNCGRPVDPIRILSLEVYSNQTKVLYVTGRGKVTTNITEPISARVEMQKKFFWGWTVIPCVDQVGSCTYDDICELNPYKNKECPSEFTTNGLPCKCPILQGKYLSKNFPLNLNILPKWIEEGKYRIQITLFKSTTELTCLLLNIAL